MLCFLYLVHPVYYTRTAPTFLWVMMFRLLPLDFLEDTDFLVDCLGKVIRMCIRDDSRALDTTYALLNFILGLLEWVRNDHMTVYVYKRRHDEFPYFSFDF